ncbi:DnaJ domain-containing protein [Tumebacillus avium]|nr:DnaJ domain-containing protein [Tumebacillus avium]
MLDESLRKLAGMELESLSDAELLKLHAQMLQWQSQLQHLVDDVAGLRAEKWWQQLPQGDARTIRLLLKGGRLTAELLKSLPALSHLMLLVDIESPDVVRLWARMSPELRAERIEELHTAISHTEVRRTTSQREDAEENRLLAYDVLGLTASASWADVKKKYRELAAHHHPDQGGDAAVFKAVQRAYRLLEGRYL